MDLRRHSWKRFSYKTKGGRLKQMYVDKRTI
jgi:hypothetical protein